MLEDFQRRLRILDKVCPISFSLCLSHSVIDSSYSGQFGSPVASGGVAAPTPTTAAFGLGSGGQMSPLMGNRRDENPLGSGFANTTPGTPGPAAEEAYYELGMPPVDGAYDGYYDDEMEDLEEEALGMAIEEVRDLFKYITCRRLILTVATDVRRIPDPLWCKLRMETLGS